MRDTEHIKRHLSVVTEIDCREIRSVEVEDPFHTTNVIVGWSLWEWLKMLFRWKREVCVRVKVRADGVAIARWFQGVDLCERCQRNRLDRQRYESGGLSLCETCFCDEAIDLGPPVQFDGEGKIRH